MKESSGYLGGTLLSTEQAWPSWTHATLHLPSEEASPHTPKLRLFEVVYNLSPSAAFSHHSRRFPCDSFPCDSFPSHHRSSKIILSCSTIMSLIHFADHLFVLSSGQTRRECCIPVNTCQENAPPWNDLVSANSANAC